jgi:hypothetical protein
MCHSYGMSYDRLKCPKCEKDFGQEAKFVDHLRDTHEVYDAALLYVELNNSGIWPTCNCSSDCKALLKFTSWKKGFVSKYARGHNARVDSVYLDAHRQREFADKRMKGYEQGKYKAWNCGLTKETSDKVSSMSQKISASLKEGYLSGRLKDWHSVDPEKSLIVAQKISQRKKELYSKGILSPWNKGLTKYDDNRVAAMSVGIKENYEENPSSSHRRLTPDQLQERIEATNSFDLVSDPQHYRNKYQKLQVRCRTCNIVQIKNLMMLENSPVCHSCSPKESRAQIEIYEFVKEFASDAVLSDRSVISPKELDIWVPSSKFAIEFNGLFWHSESIIQDPGYHQKKHAACTEKGISLLSIYEDEWRDKKNIIKGMIRHRLGKPIKVWDARKLKTSEISPLSSQKFFDENHLESYVKSTITFGILDEDGQIVAAMSLRKPFHKKYSNMIEVGRCCTLSGHSVRGWLGKLTSMSKEYARKMDSAGLMTYVDGRVGQGKGYEMAGWKLINNDTSPRFWWTDYVNRYNRFKYKADKRRQMSQVEVASEAGVVPIWGCSNRLFVNE